MSAREVLVLHNPVDEAADASTRDVLDQVAFVEGGLRRLRLAHRTVALDGGASLPDPGRVLAVFNLVESPPGQPRYQVEAAELVARRGLPCTGSPAEALWLTTDKVATRARLRQAGIAVADGVVVHPGDASNLDLVAPPWILKPAWEDASLGLEGDPVCTTPEAALARARLLSLRFPGQPVLAEHLLPGREFNLTLIEAPHGPEVLPIAEMLYLGFPPDVPRVLGYEAKWDTDSAAYRGTVRRFLEPAGEPELAHSLAATALAAWRACGVRGYARVDVRLDEGGRPCVLEVNANPCISPDSGYVASAARAGLDAAALVRRIVDCACAARQDAVEVPACASA